MMRQWVCNSETDYIRFLLIKIKRNKGYPSAVCLSTAYEGQARFCSFTLGKDTII